MEVSSFSPSLPSLPHLHKKIGHCPPPKRLRMRVFAAYDHHSGRMVDEGMIVLRKRIHEMKMVERNYEPPANWMDWEKRYYAFYDSDVCEVVGALQALLMNTRPGLAIGVMGLVTLSVPTSIFMVMSHLIDVAKGILSGA
ncbi:hypothetical protein MRB53_031426 [Persea americana]|uniref:Uncharacterized protein n=1 Tax=Persea americana TaxID=3435 RepID=A0ACC2KPC0_PERAE|nr:hypothetical protein MRB53_031426 [Persea americana]|eukprot:TRINITY_DN34223_c2_g1_i1.p1 TRINITY_DN34223_c2_g1~~TRINITY_DN34223_c2_g1_i1.p1  ORF type:complete len:140 (-),score=27.04 TRINITY_DN34223_c2_g1_i1:144-563(-)